MDNFLIQVTGKKRVTLFSPRDAQYLYLSGMFFLSLYSKSYSVTPFEKSLYSLGKKTF
jgi:hypothetical protein